MKLLQSFAVAVVLAAANGTPAGAQSIELSACRINAGPAYPSIKARCGTLVRPENPARPDGKQLDLHVAVVPALSLEPASDPLLPIAGGPGQASSNFYAATAGAFEKIRRNRDIVLLDQRGTGRSAPMDCTVDEDIVQGQMSLEQTRAATAACLSELPHDPRFFTTSVAVTDLEALREALGYTAFNLYGISYGSRVAQHFARRYPHATRTVILDGVVPPQIALGPAIATEAQKALESVFMRCAEDELCGERFPDIATKFAVLTARLADSPHSVTLPHPVTGVLETIDFGGTELATAVRLLSYHPTTVALIPFLVDEASHGNLVPLASQFLMISDTLSDSLSIGMHNAIACTEDAPFFAGEAISDEELAETYIGPVLLDALKTICSAWPAGVMDANFKTPLATEKPVLLLSGDADPITPPAFAAEAAVDMRNATFLTGRRQGHGQAPRGCTPDVMAAFVESMMLEEQDIECFERQHAMPFFLDYSGPAP